MRIVERIKDAVEHTADSWQQKLLNEYSASDEPATKARKIISELVKQLDKPNQVIINDIVSLIYALASNPDPTIDIDQVVSTAEMLIHELVEPIPNPDKKLMDELLHIVVHASSHHKNAATKLPSPVMSANVGSQSQTNGPIAQQSATAAQSMPAANVSAQSTMATPSSQPQAPSPATSAPQAPKPSSSSKGAVDNTMVKLIMDEMKEVIKKNQLTEQRITDVENRMAARITTVGDDLQGIKDKQKKQEADLETINKNLDKFISLYEVVINQYNPFIEHIDEPVKKKDPASPALSSSQATPPVQSPKIDSESAKKAATTAAQANAESSESDIHILIDKVKDMTDEAFATSKEKTAKWITTVLKDQELATAFSQSTTKAQAVKLLLSKSLA